MPTQPGDGGAAADDEHPLRGAIDRGVADEFPGLYLRYVNVPAGSGKSPRGLKQRLAVLSREMDNHNGHRIPHQQALSRSCPN